MKVDIQIARHAGPLAELESAWRELWDEQHPGAGFRSYAWISSWWNSFGAGSEPLVLVARAGRRVVGILPCYLAAVPLGGDQVRLMGDTLVGSDYLGVVGPHALAPDLARRFARHLRTVGAAELCLSELVEDDPLIGALAAEGFAAEVTPRYPCPLIRVGGLFQDYLDGLPGGAGKQFLRRRRWLERQPGYRFETLREPDEIARGMETLFDLHRRRWALEGGSDGITPGVEAFQRYAAAALATQTGSATLFVMHVDGAPRAALYGFHTGDRFSYYQAGHDPDWRQRSVGTVVLGRAIEHCFAEKLSEFDFLHGNEDYKLAWANATRRTVMLSARGPGLRPWLRVHSRRVSKLARGLVKHMLPDSAVEWIRRQRRRS